MKVVFEIFVVKFKICLGEKAQFKFEGGDSETETITFKSAALGEGASGKHVVKVSAVGANSEKVTSILCVLNDQVKSDKFQVFD